MVGTIRQSALRLAFGGHHADHLCAERFRPAHQNGANAAGSGPDQQTVARFDGPDLEQQHPGRHAFHHQGGGIFIGDAFRDFHHPVSRPNQMAGIGRFQRRIGDAVANSQIAHALADGFNNARAFKARNGRQSGRIEPGANICVDEVQPDCRLADQNLSGSRRIQRDRFLCQNVRTTMLMNTNCAAFNHLNHSQTHCSLLP